LLNTEALGLVVAKGSAKRADSGRWHAGSERVQPNFHCSFKTWQYVALGWSQASSLREPDDREHLAAQASLAASPREQQARVKLPKTPSWLAAAGIASDSLEIQPP
jgi:hypothetical protein